MEQAEGATAQATSDYVFWLKQNLKLSSIALSVSLMAPLSLLMASPDLKGHVSNLHLVICGFLTFSNIVCAIVTIFLLNHQNPSVQRGRAPIILLIISCSLLILTAASFLTLLPKHYTFLAALLPASLLLSMLFYCIIRTGDGHSTTGYEGNKSELKQSFTLSADVTSLAFSGFISTIVGVTKNSSGQALSKNMEVCILLLSFASLVGLVLMLLSSAPPWIEHQRISELLPMILKALAYALLGSLLLIAAMAASAFLEASVVVVICLLPFLGVLVCFAMEWHTQNISTNDDHREEELKLISKFATTTASISFGGMIGAFSGFHGSRASDLQIKICVLVMFLAFASSFSVKLLTFKAPESRFLITVIKILNTCAVLLLAIVPIAVYFVEFLAVL